MSERVYISFTLIAWLIIIGFLVLRLYFYYNGYSIFTVSRHEVCFAYQTGENGTSLYKSNNIHDVFDYIKNFKIIRKKYICDQLKGYGTIYEFPIIKGNRQIIKLHTYKIIINTNKNYIVGDKIVIRKGKFKLDNQKYDILNGKIIIDSTSDKEKFLKTFVNTGFSKSREKTVIYVYYPDIATFDTSGNASNIFFKVLNYIRKFIINKVQFSFKKPISSYILGAIIGYTDNLSSDLKSQLQTSGLIHILVVSGYNISLLLGILFLLLAKYSVKLYLLVTGVFLVIFVGIVGINPPVLRAVIVGLIGAFARISGKPSQSLYLLFISGVILLFIFPYFLLSISFQLSFLATLAIILAVDVNNRFKYLKLARSNTGSKYTNGVKVSKSSSFIRKGFKNLIILLSPNLKPRTLVRGWSWSTIVIGDKKPRALARGVSLKMLIKRPINSIDAYRFEPFYNYIKDEIVILFSIQIFIIPIISYYFGVINFSSVITNLLVGWVVPYVTIFSIVFLLSFGFIKAVLSLIIYSLVVYIDTIASIFANVQVLSVSYTFSVRGLLVWYMSLAIMYVIYAKIADTITDLLL